MAICDWLSMFASFTQVHTNACNFLTDAPIDTCFTGNIMWSFGIYCAKYSAVIDNHYKITTLYISKNLHTNMKGFRRTSCI